MEFFVSFPLFFFSSAACLDRDLIMYNVERTCIGMGIPYTKNFCGALKI